MPGQTWPRTTVNWSTVKEWRECGAKMPFSLYAKSANFCGDDAVERASLLADHAAIAIEAEASARRAESLVAALHSNRTIGAALGILMERHDLTPDGAFQVLRQTSSYSNRKLAVIAEELVHTGHLPAT